VNSEVSTSSVTTISVDQESRIGIGDHLSLKIWLRLLTCTNMVEAEIKSGLRLDFDSTLPRFDLLAQLDRIPEGLLMNELSKRLMVTNGNVTSLADQLEAEGMIAREPVENDRRATRLKLTPDGKQQFATMATVHESWVAQMFSSLDRDEQIQLHQLLAKLKNSLHKPLRNTQQ
jgi:DNA-binding MarR family transcriptional regulator